MNKWLDELEWLLESGGYSVVLKNDYETRLDRDFRVAVDRLIAIAKGAEWLDFMGGDWCPICGAEAPPGGPHAHYGDCPYHYDWGKE